MKLTYSLLLFFLLSIPVFAQFPMDLALGPGVNAGYSQRFSLIRMNGRFHIPGDVSDFEADIISVAVLPRKQYIQRFGVSWISLLWVPPALLKNKLDFLGTPTVLLMGVNTLLNPSISWGNSWIRGTAGYKNDIFIFRDALWIFEPHVGCKFALPENSIFNSYISLGLSFPALISNEKEMFADFRNFRPKLSLDLCVFGFYPDVFLEAQ